MIVDAAVLVVGEEDGRALPLRALHHGLDDLRDERLRLAGLYNAAHAQANALHVKNTSMQLQLDALRRAYGANSVDAVVKAVKA